MHHVTLRALPRAALTVAALTVAALACAPSVARADDRVLYLREEGARTAAPPNAVLPGAAPPPEAAAYAETARTALARARELFLAYDFRGAATTLRVAAAETVEHLVRTDRALALEMLHQAGACAFLAEDREGSREAFRRAAALDPEARLPASVFPPEVEGFFEEIRRGALFAEPSVRTIRTLPTGARIEVDGREWGVTPVTLRLTAGVHYLRLERVGYRTWMGPLQVEGPSMPDQEIALAEATGPDLRAQIGRPEGLAQPPDGPTLARVVREYGVDRVVVSLRDGTELRHPPPSPFPWAWVAVGAGAAVVAAGVSVGLFFALRPQPTYQLVAPP